MNRLFDATWRRDCFGFKTVLLGSVCIARVKSAGGAWKLCRGRRCASAVKRRPIVVKRGFVRVSIRHFSRRLRAVRSASAYGAFYLMAVTLCLGFANDQLD